MPVNPLGSWFGDPRRDPNAQRGGNTLRFPPTATAPPQYPGLNPAITSLLTPGLVPDIARQSAEVSAGRGVGGSPAGDSTAVRMSEQNWLQRLALANSLMGGEADRSLPYQITPYNSAGLQNQRDIAQAQFGKGGQSFGGGGGGGRGPTEPAPQNTPWAGFQSYAGTRQDEVMPGAGQNWWTFGAGAGQAAPTMDDIYNSLGIGDYGSQPGEEGYVNPDDFLSTDFGPTPEWEEDWM